MEDKVVCCITDNTANITKAIQITKWTHFACLAHTINLIVRDALNGLKPILNKVKEAVEYFHRSILGAKKSSRPIRSKWGWQSNDPNRTASQDGTPHITC